MKKTITLILGCLIFLFSCEDIFHEPETSIADIQTEEELVQAAEGVWGKLAWAINYPNPVSFYFQNLKGDDITYNSADYNSFYPSSYSVVGCFSISEEHKRSYPEYSDYLYESFYLVIASVNNILVQFPNYIESDELTKQIIGEMFLIRAYCYFRLTRTYGQIPLILDIEVKSSVNNSSFTEIYNCIEKDLKTASTLLPQNSQSSRIPYKRPGKGSAKAILAEVYLNWAGYPNRNPDKYVLAANLAEGLIDSAAYYGFELLTDFAHVWDESHKINDESVFCIYYSDIENITEFDQVNQLYSGNAIPYVFSSDIIYLQSFEDDTTPERQFSFTGIEESAFFAAELNFFNSYPNSYRRDLTFFTDLWVPPTNYFEFKVDTGYIHIDTLTICDRAGYRKFFHDNGFCLMYSDLHELFNPDSMLINHSGGYYYEGSFYLNSEKVYLYRFAHTLLTYAETKARAGQLDEKAYEAINRIRRRAHNVDQFTPSKYDLTPGLSPEVFADSVVWERAWELAGEPEGRYFDLLRLEKLEDLSKYRHPKEDSPPWHRITKEDYFLPIPDKVIN